MHERTDLNCPPGSLNQSKGLATGLKAAGSNAAAVPILEATHMTLNRELGSNGAFATGEVGKFLAAVR